MSATRVLVVEDENIIAKDIADTLIKLEYEVSGIASSSEDALKNIEKNNVDLVLMDIVLKGQIDGIKTADIIRSRFHIPVIYLTAYSDDETLQRAKVTGPFGYLLKPLEERELQTAIQMALYKHKMDNAIRESEERLSRFMNSAIDGFMLFDSSLDLIEINRSALELFNWEMDEVIGRNLLNLWPGVDMSGRRDKYLSVIDTGEPLVIDDMLSPGGEYFSTRAFKVEDGLGLILTETKKAGTETEDSVKKYEEAFRVFRHKVKNNLQSLYSLISLQAHHMSGECGNICSDCKDRVKTLSLVYDRLFKADKTVPIFARDYITDIVSYLFRSHNAGRKGIGYRVESADIKMDLNMSVPLGLMINELVSNAIRYAFSDGKKGEIWVKLEYDCNKYKLEVGDNGTGLPEGIDLKSPKTLGLELVTSLASQLDGELELSGPGAVFRLVFPVTDDEEGK